MPREKRNDVAVKIDADIIRRARAMCSYRGVPMAKYLSELLRAPVERDFEKFTKEIAKESK